MESPRGDLEEFPAPLRDGHLDSLERRFHGWQLEQREVPEWVIILVVLERVAPPRRRMADQFEQLDRPVEDDDVSEHLGN